MTIDPSPILLTGATGVVGLAVVKRLLQEGYTLRALVRDAAKARTLLPPNVELIEAQITDVIALEAALKGCQTCIHIAGLVGFDDSLRQQLLETNHGATASVVNACLAQEGFRHLIHFGSIAAIPLAVGDKQTIPRPSQYSSYYGFTKKLSELEVHRGAAEGLGFTILEPSVVLAPHPDLRSSSSLVRIAAKPTTFCPPGDIHWVAGADVAEAVAQAIARGPEGKTYILDGKTTSWELVFRRYRQAAGIEGGRVIPVSSSMLGALSLVAPIINRITGLPIPTRKQLRGMVEKRVYAGLDESEALLGRPFMTLEATISEMISSPSNQ